MLPKFINPPVVVTVSILAMSFIMPELPIIYLAGGVIGIVLGFASIPILGFHTLK